jgi:DNA polymerase-3 subunit epsilon
MDMFSEPVVYLDIETSGSSPAYSKIIEIGAIRVEGGVVVDELKTLVNPGGSLPYWITKLTGITDNDLIGAPYFDDIAYQLHQLLKGAIFIAHNARFDYSYIKRQLADAGYTYAPKLLCTVRLSRALYPAVKGHSLQKIIERHDIAVSARHRAYDDAKAIKDFSELAFAEHGSQVFFEAVSKQFKTQSLPPHMDEQDMQTVKNTPGVYVFEDEAGLPIYVGKSVSVRSRVLSHFNQDNKQSKEMKISQNTHKLRVIETGNELDALLLESKMVKDLLPLYNKQLRRANNHVVFVKGVDALGYTTITLDDRNLAQEADITQIYGIYPTRSKAKASLEEKRRTFSLCSKLLGLERSEGACFLYQLNKCRGACCGKESPASYNLRVELALQRTKIETWPYQSAVVITSGEGNSLVVDKWVVLGYVVDVEAGDPYFKTAERSFDIDTYRILRGYLAKYAHSLHITPISFDTLQQSLA